MTEQTIPQQLRPVKELLGRAILLKPYQTVKTIKIEPDFIGIVLEIKEYTETPRQIHFTKSGLRMLSWRRDKGQWIAQEVFTIWDEDFLPITEVKFGRSITPEQYYEQLAWEAQTYRCGTARTPLDSFTRAIEGDTTDAMYQYWTGHDRAEVFRSGGR